MDRFDLSKLGHAQRLLTPQFRKADSNRNGFLNQDEVRAQAARAGDGGVTEAALVSIYNWAKSDHWDELVTPDLAAGYIARTRQKLEGLDRNGDGFLAGTELKDAQRLKTGKALMAFADLACR